MDKEQVEKLAEKAGGRHDVLARFGAPEVFTFTPDELRRFAELAQEAVGQPASDAQVLLDAARYRFLRASRFDCVGTDDCREFDAEVDAAIRARGEKQCT